MAAVVLMVILRLSLGCHFFYEGVWKVTHPEFSAEGFLRQAKGPAAGMFHAMLPDVDGHQRLKIQRFLAGEKTLDAWAEARSAGEERFLAKLKNAKKSTEETDELLGQFRIDSEQLLWNSEDKLAAALAKSQGGVLAYFASLEEELPAETNPGEENEFPVAIKALLNELAGIEKGYHTELARLVCRETGGNAPVFTVMVPVIDEKVGIEGVVVGSTIRNLDRQEILTVRKGITGSQYIARLSDLKLAAIEEYGIQDEQKYEVKKLYRLYKDSLRQYLDENQEEIAAYFGALAHWEERKSRGNSGALYEKGRMHNERKQLRQEVAAWFADFEEMDGAYRSALWKLLTPEQKEQGPLPRYRTRTDLINFAVTYGLTAIGLCLLLGLFTRPAALGGACFMLFVILTQPNWPTIYPPATPAEGHALLIDRNFIEMIALLTVAMTCVGRWAGLDYFVENYIVYLYRLITNKTKPEKKEEDKPDESDA